MLPNGRGVLFYTVGADLENTLAVYDFESGQRTNLLPGTTPHFTASGHLTFWRQGSLWAVPFDADRLEVTGDPLVVVQGVATFGVLSTAAYTLADNGTLAYLSGNSSVDRSLVWVDRLGRSAPLVDEKADYLHPRLSPDETRVAVSIQGDIWICEDGRACRPLTSNGGTYPVWTPDGARVAFQSFRDGSRDLYWRAADGSDEVERLLSREGFQFPMSWSPDGEVLAFTEGVPAQDILLLRPGGEPEEYLATESLEATPTFSPDGRWIAYRSDDAGQMRLYVRPYPGPGGAQLVSLQGGEEPAWARDSRELFFRDGDRMMAVEVGDGETFSSGTPKFLFEGYALGTTRNYDVTDDGQRFVMVMSESATESELRVVLNFDEELRRLFPDQ
jgi:serine/threonine-protein kinase